MLISSKAKWPDFRGKPNSNPNVLPPNDEFVFPCFRFIPIFYGLWGRSGWCWAGVRPLSTRLWSFNESTLYGRLDETPGRKRYAITEASPSVLRLSIKATRIRRGSRRAMRSDIRNTLGNILHAASLTLSWAVASDMID